jgi:AAHS family 4-hydroxybenzoate transporter-like MFS transporter
VAGFSAFTLLSALSTTLWELTLSRFLIGLCVGALLPNAVILAGELVKDAARARTSAGVTLGITLGSSFAGVAAAALLPAYGWRGLAVFGGVIPLLFSGVLWAALPESPVFGAREKVSTPMKWTPAPLFRDGLGGMTLAIWLLVILLSMSLYLLSNWMPLLLRQSGLDTSQASLAGGVYYFGGLIGGVLIVVLLGRAGWRTLATFLVLAALSVLVVSHVHRPVLALMVSLAIAGVFMTGSQAAFNGLGASAYPAAVRASGFGYALGVMRIGTISGPMLGATLIAGGLNDAQSLFLIPVGPLLIAACAATWLAMRSRRLTSAAAT